MTVSATNAFASGYRLRSGEDLNANTTTPLNLVITQANTSESQIAAQTAGTFPRTTAGILTAFATGGQANATQMTGVSTNVTTVATAGDSVKLPPGIAGGSFCLSNSSANAMQVFGNGTDLINNIASATGVSHAAGSNAVYFCVSAQPASRWFRVISS